MNSASAFPVPSSALFSRRQMLAKSGYGIGSVALAWLLKQEGLLATSESREIYLFTHPKFQGK